MNYNLSFNQLSGTGVFHGINSVTSNFDYGSLNTLPYVPPLTSPPPSTDIIIDGIIPFAIIYDYQYYPPANPEDLFLAATQWQNVELQTPLLAIANVIPSGSAVIIPPSSAMTSLVQPGVAAHNHVELSLVAFATNHGMSIANSSSNRNSNEPLSTQSEGSSNNTSNTNNLSNTLLSTDLTPRSVSLHGVVQFGKNTSGAKSFGAEGKNSANYITSIGNATSYKLDNGNLLLCPQQNIVIETSKGNVQIGKGCIALVSSHGDDVVVLDLHDSSAKGVKVLVGNDSVTLSPGMQLVLTNKKDSFDKVNPCRSIACRQEKESTASNGTRVWSAKFSMLSAIASIGPLHSMLESNDRKDRQIIGQIKLNAAILSQLHASHGPYKFPKG